MIQLHQKITVCRAVGNGWLAAGCPYGWGVRVVGWHRFARQPGGGFNVALLVEAGAVGGAAASPLLVSLLPRKARVLQRTLEPSPHWRLYCTIRRLPFVARRWRRRRRRLADGGAAGWPTSRPRFGKGSSLPKATTRSGQRSVARPTTLSPIHTSGPLPNHQPHQLDKLKYRASV